MNIFVQKRFAEVRSSMILSCAQRGLGALPPTSKEHVGYPHALLAKIIGNASSSLYKVN